MTIRPRLLLAAVLLLVSFAAAAADFATLHAQGLQAYKAKDHAGLAQRMREALALRPNHPRTLYNLAAALALQGRAEESVALLERLAAMQLGYRVDEDKDFDSLKRNRKFKAVLRRFIRNRAPRGRSISSFMASTPHFFPEGIAYDPESYNFLLSSVAQRRVLKVSRAGAESNLVPPATNGLWSALGMAVDPATRVLWVASSALPEMDGYTEADRGRAGLFGFGLADGAPRARHLLPADGREHVLGDVIVGDKGLLYTTDSKAGLVWQVDAASGRYSALTAPGALESPQGLTLSADGRRLYVADYDRGLFVLDLGTRQLQPVAAPEDVCLYGIDGLYREGKYLAAIQNGTRPNRVMRFRLDDSGQRIDKQKVLVANHEDFDEPTLGVMVDGRLYFVANSQWNRLGKDRRLPKGDDSLRSPLVLGVGVD